MNELYFRMRLTESEHSFVAHDIEDYCAKNALEFRYYRKMKNGHVPMIRECKVIGTPAQLGYFRQWMRDNHITEYITPNEKGL